MAAEPKVQARPKNWLLPFTLVLLKEEDSYGYELMEQIEEQFGFEEINAGSVYRTLRQMENEGLCQSSWDTTNGRGPARRVYSITDAGEAYLDFWARSLEQYQRNVDTFFRLYTGSRQQRASEKKSE